MIAANVDATLMEGETGEVVEEQEVEEGEQELEEKEEEAMERSVPTQGKLALATANTPMPTPDYTYSTILSSSQPAPLPIYSIATTSAPSNLVPISDAMTDTLRFALRMGHHPASLQQRMV